MRLRAEMSSGNEYGNELSTTVATLLTDKAVKCAVGPMQRKQQLQFSYGHRISIFKVPPLV